jgi:hypothetical protein
MSRKRSDLRRLYLINGGRPLIPMRLPRLKDQSLMLNGRTLHKAVRFWR